MKGVKRYRLPIKEHISHEDVIYSMVNIVNHIVLHIWKLLKEYILTSSHHKRKIFVTLYSDGLVTRFVVVIILQGTNIEWLCCISEINIICQVCGLVVWLFPTLCDPMVCPWNSPGKSGYIGVGCHFLLQGIVPWDRIEVSCITGRFFTIWAMREAQLYLSFKKRTLV